eukprot:Blabericola_migrator_1__5246@NODE_269_length_10566_cov_217_328317_g225_i0_p2_GENE_NODE_269_length_10566_cov_217_328317_g225_i0NODE_269_length_10566_cov_217_328317_g225_i0_p2_ORF_typecomplete_len869_score173_21CPW_WPC/PF09717_10/2e02CPW_WPC/PF09717_10/1_8e04CPW_WPC/PF09717_10/4_2e03CPW_WPC/PF09717_10/5_9e02CPW_WPC/PF09717_10/1_2e03CPW_WPC/PF09717_10/4_4cEGF/PF12662_7/34cEGF/PF12662_7/2_1e03cEGF/PF12662_7/1e02cEGF/PF12662_7/2_3e02cEGF/PF12662_7/2e02cEGF/PF12662_7/3_7e02cEGF/PF12662_7/4e02_NODE_269
MRRVILIVCGVCVDGARTQAHLPLQHGLPPVPYIDPPAATPVRHSGVPQYADDVMVGGSPVEALRAAVQDLDSIPLPFNEWDVNHIAPGPAVFDCPDGFSLTESNTCIFLEYRHAEESCPYGSFRERLSRQCVQVDSVPPDRTCPAGFEYFMRGCIRRTQIPPLLTCPPGYSQVESTCYSVSSVPPIPRCPLGTIMDPSRKTTLRTNASQTLITAPTCYKEKISQPLYECPPQSRLVSQSLQSSPDVRQIDVPITTAALNQRSVWTVSTSKPQCLLNSSLTPLASCPSGFMLVSGKDIELAQGLDDLLTMKTQQSFGMEEMTDLKCIKVAEYKGKLTCPFGHVVNWPTKSQYESLKLDAFRGARCVPASGSILRGVSKQVVLSEDTKPKWGVKPDTIRLFSERTELFDEEAVLGKPEGVQERRKRRRGLMPVETLRSLLAREGVETKETPLQTADATPAHDVRSLTENSTSIFPTIVFDRQSCWAQNLNAIRWITGDDITATKGDPLSDNPFLTQLRSMSDALWTTASSNLAVSVPLCRELQTVEAHLSCPSQTSFKCLVSNHDTLSLTEEDDGALRRNLQMLMTETDRQDASIRACVTELQAEAVCQPPDQTADARPLCPAPHAKLELRPMQALNVDGGGSLAYKVATCVEVYEEEAFLECPFGVGTVGNDTGRCDVLLAQPLSSTCPEGFTRGTQEKSKMIGFAGLKGNKKIGYQAAQVDGGICELVEYADYQITCPAGYTRDRAKNTAAACLAEKLIPPSILCPPGFLPTDPEQALAVKNPLACVKTVEVAPTVISLPQESTPNGPIEGGMATACVLTKEHRLSCGVERKYHGITDWEKQRLFGDAFKAKADQKVRAHTDKYSHV